MERAGFQDIIARKLQRERDRFQVKEIPVKSMGKSLLFKKPSEDIVLDTIDALGTDNSARSVLEAYKKLIYLCCDMLQSPDLHQELEVVDPFDTVGLVFDMEEIMQIGDQLSDFAGFGDVGEQLKN